MRTQRSNYIGRLKYVYVKPKYLGKSDEIMANTAKRYTDEEQNDFCELAQTIGIGRAIRELGYPSFPTAILWMEKRGIEPAHNDIMATARKYQRFYETEDLLKTIDDGIAVVEEMYAKVQTPDDAKKLAEAIQKLMNTRLLLEGKANAITEKRETTQADLEIAEMLRIEKAKQADNQETPAFK